MSRPILSRSTTVHTLEGVENSTSETVEPQASKMQSKISPVTIESLMKPCKPKIWYSSDTPAHSDANSAEDCSPVISTLPSRASSGDSLPNLLELVSIKAKRAMTLDVPGLTRSKVSPDGRISSRDVGAKLVIVMVGLPARGKSYIVEKLARYYNWQGHRCKVFNIGNMRRQSYQGVFHDAAYFDPANTIAKAQREKVALDTLEILLNWILCENGSVAIYDATNTTVSRRTLIFERINREPHLKALFLESICTDKSLLEINMRLKLRGPDYKDRDSRVALEDFKQRIQNYEKFYVPIGAEDEALGIQYCKLINVNKKLICYNIQGFLSSQAVYFLVNFNLEAKMIWIARHGESSDNFYGKIGGNAHLTDFGRKFAASLARFIDEKRIEFRNTEIEQLACKWSILPEPGEKAPNLGIHTSSSDIPSEKSFCVWTSLLNRSIETASFFDDEIYDVKGMRMLDEILAGKIEGLTYKEFKEKYPEEYEARIKDQLHYKFPGLGGESYLDVIHRLNPVIVEIERMDHHLLVLGHRVTTRILLAYFLGLDQETICKIDIPMHSVYCIQPRPYGTDCTGYIWDPEQDAFFEQEGPLTRGRRPSTTDNQKKIKETNNVNLNRDSSDAAVLD